MQSLFRVEPYRSGDEALCRDLLKSVFGDDSLSRAYYQLHPDRTLVALAGDRVVGLASVWDNPNHPYASRCGVVVLPSFRRRGIGTLLWGAVIQRDTEDRPLVTALWETQWAGYQFAIRCGFREIRRTHAPMMAINQVDAPCADVEEWLAKEGYRLVPYRDADKAERGLMAELLRKAYAATHTANPLGPFSAEEWSARAFPDDLLPWGSFAVMDGDVCIAAALLHSGGSAAEVDLGWRGVAEAYRHHARALIVVMTARQMEEAARRGFEQVRLECDSTDPWSRDVLDRFPFRPAPTWITLRRGGL